jgi:prepilin-type N-terminal cleavage/methylation domain-containing protein
VANNRLRQTDGFTLVEIVVVLVIISLITGGVIVGKDLIRQSEVNSVMVEANKFKTAYVAFKQRYRCVPGDCANAENFFGTDSSGCPYGGGATGTCNGDGDGELYATEALRFWQQLALAGLIDHSYRGVGDSHSGSVWQGGEFIAGTTIPKSKLGDAAWNIWYLGGPAEHDNSNYYANGNYGNAMLLGAFGWWIYENPILSPAEMYALDSKYDDGYPAAGRIQSKNWNGNWYCTDAGWVGAGASYSISNTGPQCTLVMPRFGEP